MPQHALNDVAGALATLFALALLAAGGYLLALRLLGAERARADTLELAVAALLAATAEAVGIGLALGACGQLRIGLAVAVQAAVCALLAAGWSGPRRLRREDVAEPARLLARRLAARLRQHPALAVLALHAIGSEALRGLLRPPLSWDALMYHLLLTATWLQRHDLAPVFGAYPFNYYGYSPGNGSVWLWWWMAPSHGEIYANVAFLPQWALLALATGAVARRLGARRSWPLAAFLVGLVPTVVRFAATQYVDIFTAACLLAACACGLSWLRTPRRGTAALAGLGLGIAAGAKVIGLFYAGGLAALLLLLAPRAWRRRLPQAALALGLALALGGFFYLRNAAHGAGPLALQCEGLPHKEPVHGLPSLPRPSSVAALPHQMLAEGRLPRALLGSVDDRRSPFQDLGLGPQALLLLLAVPALAWLPPGRRREGLIVGGQVVLQAAFWATVPYAANNHVFANIRYLLPAVALAMAGGFAAAESRLDRTAAAAGDGAPSAGDRWLAVVAVALAAQDLLQLHTQMSDGARLGVALADAAAVALVLAPRPRHWLAAPRRAAAAAAVALLAAVLAAPWLASFRAADRTRAFDEEYTAHGINVSLFASGWDWLDHHGGSGTVAVLSAPDTFFLYPAMGPDLSRRAVYVNVNAADLADAAAYPLCQPRVDPSAAAWIANLRRGGVRWLDLSRTPPYPFSMEDAWARARADLFALRFADANNRIYEVLR
jgi:hypothetical protein